jgi:hypothetical protein
MTVQRPVIMSSRLGPVFMGPPPGKSSDRPVTLIIPQMAWAVGHSCPDCYRCQPVTEAKIRRGLIFDKVS